MKKYCIALVALVALIQASYATTYINLEPDNVLSVADSQGSQVSTIGSRTISEKVTTDNQSFRISFGQDLEGRHTIIIYPDPETPQSLDLNILGQPVQMTQDSVLTITANDDGTSSLYQAGVLGEITLAGSPISPGSSLSIENGQMIATTPQLLLDEEEIVAEAKMDQEENNLEKSSTTASYDQSVKTFTEGMIVKQVSGTVMMAPPGQDIMDVLRSSTDLPTLKEGDVIPNGASVRTDFGAELIVAQSPGVTFQLLPNTNIEFTDNAYKVENGVEKRSFKAKMQKGGIISNLDNVDPKHTDYQIKTPIAVAAARGTSFAVYGSSTTTVIITNTGAVTVTDSSGNVYTASVGKKVAVTFDSISGSTRTAEFTANTSEMQAVRKLVRAAQTLNTVLNNSQAGTNAQTVLENQLLEAVENFQSEVNPTLNPGAITPTTSP